MMTKCVSGIKYFQSTGTKYKTEAQAVYERWVSELRRQIDSGGIIKKEEIKPAAETTVYFNEFAERYLSWVKDRQKSYNVKKYIIKIVVEHFKNKKLIDFNYRTIEYFQSFLLNKGLKATYINKIITVLKHMFSKALDWELMNEDTLKKVRKVKLLKGEIKRLRYLSDDEADRLLLNCDSYLKPIVVMALHTGMRRGEMLGLTWNRVDMANRVILLDKTKNGGRREIPMNNTLHIVLSGLTRHIKTDFVFYNTETLKPFFDLERIWRKALNKSHILDFHFHDLRHTFASRLVMKGIDLMTIKELLGHKDIKMTMRYSHLSHAHIKNAVSSLDIEDKKSYLFLTSDENGKLSNP